MKQKESPEKLTLVFEPDKVPIRVDTGANILEAALAADVHVNATCGGQGVCGKCRIIVKSGDVESEKTEHISAEDFEKGWRQACKTLVLSDCTIEIPVESRGPKGLVDRRLDMGTAERKVSGLEMKPLAEGWKLAPMAIKIPVRLAPPTLKDNTSDLSRLLAGLRQQHHIDDVAVEVRCLKDLPSVLRAGDWLVTVTLLKDPAPESSLAGAEKKRPFRLARVEEGDSSGQNLAVALDVGTTTVNAELVDLTNGTVLAEAGEYNGQIKYGDDVITRIVFAQKPGGKEKLQSAVVSSINQVIDELLEQSGHPKNAIACVAAAGNTTMTHLLLGLESRYLREAPYVPEATFVPLERVGEVGIDLPDCVHLCSFPSVASYVGGDIVSGILGSGIFQREALTLYMDIGTNGEIVLGNRDWLACAACSMGPAFEGGGIKHGMRADLGAIEGFHINALTLEPMVITVGKRKPRGICGSGLISVLAALLSAGVIDRNGKFVQDLSSERLRAGDFGHEYVLAWGEDSETGRDIVITEVDIENLVRAKAALFAGCLTLLETLSLSFDDLDSVVIAGAFGRYINLEKGKMIGLFPDIDAEKFFFLGNGSLLGAQLVCLSRDMFHEAERIAKMMTNVELSDNQSFMDKYMAALFLPHTDGRLFPDVGKSLEANWETVRREREGRL